MRRLLSIENAHTLSLLQNSPTVAALPVQAFTEHRPDEHWVVVGARDDVMARVSLWWRAAPRGAASLAPQRLGVIGHYAAGAAEDDPAAALLLNHACARLAAQGCTQAVGPMDGNTWRHYRFITQRRVEGPAQPAFFLEPDNHDAWPGQFTRAGFAPLAHYTSAVTRELTRTDPRTQQLSRRLGEHGVTIRALNIAALERDLSAVYALSLASFADNFLYTPISAGEFLAQYHALQPHLRPELVMLTEREGKLLGYLFALPDIAQQRRGENIDTVILKTVARVPQRAVAGLGHVLVERCHQVAHELGYRRVIHALMHENNRSVTLSAKYAAVFRRYTLFARELAPA